MKPAILKIHGTPPNARHIESAAEALRMGHVVLAPTETGYCFFGDPESDAVFETLLKLRPGHPRNKPLSLLCGDLKQVASIATLDTPVYRVASRVLPGPYTFILPCTRKTPGAACGPKRKTVGVRVSDHPVATALVKEFGAPLVLTSVTDAEELIGTLYYEDVQDPDSWWVSPEAILSKCASRVPFALEWNDFVPMRVSTVVDFTVVPPVIIRDGGWPTEALGIGTD